MTRRPGILRSPDSDPAGDAGGTHEGDELRTPVPLSLPKERSERRRGGRFTVNGVHSDLGEVEDLSCTGCRIERKGRLPEGQESVPLMLSDGETSVRLHATIRRELKRGFRRWEYGLEFNDVPAKAQAALTKIASACRMKRVL